MSAGKQSFGFKLQRGVNFIPHNASNGYTVSITDSSGNVAPQNIYIERRKDRTLEIEWHAEDPFDAIITIIG
jgi:hypothetical protein